MGVVNDMVQAGALVVWTELSGHFPVERLGAMNFFRPKRLPPPAPPGPMKISLLPV